MELIDNKEENNKVSDDIGEIDGQLRAACTLHLMTKGAQEAANSMLPKFVDIEHEGGSITLTVEEVRVFKAAWTLAVDFVHGAEVLLNK